MTHDGPINVFLVEDDEALGMAVADSLRLEGMVVELFGDAKTALAALPDDFPGVVVSDVRLPGMDGLSLFSRLQEQDPDLPVIFTTGHGDVDMAVAAMKEGAADFLTKPYSSSALIRSIMIASGRRRLVLENRRLRLALKQQAQGHFIGSSEFAVKMRAMLSAVAQSEVDVVIDGATGTGKTFAARLIHELGPRQNRAFVAIDAGMLTHQDAELLLFGREPSRDGLSRTGLLERANGGTLLIDEIEAANPLLQARILSAITTRSILPAGAERPRKLNLCVMVTRNISEASDQRPDNVSQFHMRLSAVKLTMAPLINRGEDISLLFHHFLAQNESELGLPHRQVPESVWQYLQTHHWPGNIRELTALARTWAIGLNLPEITAHHAVDGRPLHVTVAEFERAVIENTLRSVGGNVFQLELALGTPRKTLYDKLSRYGLRPKDFR